MNAHISKNKAVPSTKSTNKRQRRSPKVEQYMEPQVTHEASADVVIDMTDQPHLMTYERPLDYGGIYGKEDNKVERPLYGGTLSPKKRSMPQASGLSFIRKKTNY